MADLNSLRALTKEMEEMSKTLVDGLPEIDEGNFVTHFLPLLTSKNETTDLTPWLAVSGRGSVPVRVYRIVNGIKKYIYTVPPLIDTTGLTKTVYLHSRSMSQVLTTAINVANSRPAGMRDKIIEQHLQRADIGTSNVENSIAAWNYVLRMNRLEPLTETLPPDADLSLLPDHLPKVHTATNDSHVPVDGYDDAW